jgi:zinc protease
MVQYRTLLGAAAILLAPLTVPPLLAQEPVPAHTIRVWDHESSDIPVDARIHFGALENGMRFAWVDHGEPKDRIYVRLHVDAGSFGETDSEAGMAHFLEHMAFNGSEHFKAGTLIEWFQEHGMSFGADTNAHTAFSETVYKLDLPDRDPATLRDGLQVMRDFASGLLIAEDEVKAEKGVIDGEERERDSAGFRVLKENLKRQYGGTLLATRLPIGSKDVRDEFSAETVRSFYEKWYRPENMTLVIVGDLRELSPESLVKEMFNDMTGPGTPVDSEPALGSPAMDDLFYSIYDEEIPSVQMAISMLKPYVDRPDTIAQRVADLPRGVAHAMLRLRFSEAVKKPETPYLNASVSNAGGLEIFEGGQLNVVSAPDKWQEAMTAAYLELRKALNFGFQQAELDEIRANFLRGLDEAVDREATAHSAGIREAILHAAESGGVPSDAHTDRDILKPAIESLTLEACLIALRENWRGGKLSITTAGSLQLENAETELKEIYNAAREIEIKADETLSDKAFAYASEPREVSANVKKDQVEDLDFWMVEFENGVRLNIKKTDYKERQILMYARLGNGSLGIADEALVSASLAGFTFSGGGLAEHSADDLRRLMAGKQVGVTMGVEDDHFGFSGATTAEDLLLQFELTCAFMQHAGYRPDMLNIVHAQLPIIFEQFKHTLNGPLRLEFSPAILQGDPRGNILGIAPFPSQEELAAVDMDAIRAAISGPMKNAHLEITVVGDLDVDAVIAAAARTFGALPERRPEALQTHPSASLASEVNLQRSIDTADEKATLLMFFPTTDGFDRAVRRNLSFLGTVVDDRLRLEVRERLGAAYSPGAQVSSSQVFEGLGGIMIQAAGDPEKITELIEACQSVAADLAENGVAEEEIQRLSEPLLKQLRDAKRTNGFWMRSLYQAQIKPESLDGIRDLVEFYQNIDAEALNRLAAKYLIPERSSRLVVLPQ